MSGVATWAGVGLLGALGALLRYAVTRAALASHRPPWTATLAVNLAGSFALGLLTGAEVAGDALFLAGTGFLGALTTFSTWMVEARWTPFVVPVALAAGLAATVAGWALGAALV